MEWSNEVVMEFLELYEGEPAIWNPKHPQHKNRNLVHDAWKRIQTKLSLKVATADLKKKKDALMATFRKLAQKVKANSGTGTGTDEVFKPDWFAYEYMSKFLQGIYRPTKTTNSEGLQEGNAENENTEENDGNKPDDDGSTENVVDHEISTTSTKLSGNQGSAFKPPTSSGHNRKRKAETMTNIESRMDEAYQVFKNLSKAETTDSDECSLYTELLAKKLRALDENTRGIAILEIDHLMYRLKQSNNFMQRPPPFIQTYTYPSAQNFPQNMMQNYYQPPPGYPSAISFPNYSQQSSSPSLSSHSPSPSPQSHTQQSDEKDSFQLTQDSTEAEGREQLSLDLDTLINL